MLLQPEEDKTIWQVPLQLLVVDSKTGDKKVHSDIVLTEREMTIDLPNVKGVTYKLNAETCGVCASSLPRPSRSPSSPSSQS